MKNIKIFLIVLLISIAIVFIEDYLVLGIFLLILFLFAQKFTPKDLILLFLFSLLVISSDISESARQVINFSTIIFFIFIFIKTYGLNTEGYPKLPYLLHYYVVLVISSLVISSIFSNSISLGFQETIRQVLFFIICYILFSFLEGEKDIIKYASVLVASGLFISLTIIYSFLTSDIAVFLFQTKGIIHEGGSFKNVASAAGIFASAIPLNLIFIFYFSNNKKLKIFLYTILFSQVLGLFLTNSRSGLISVFVSTTIILFILRRGIFKKFVFVILLFFSVFKIFSPPFSDLINTYFRMERVFENTRFYLWDMSFEIIKENPFFGTGPGQFKNFMYNHIPVMLGTWEESQIAWIHKESGLGESHNFLLFRTAELGILGFLTALLLPLIFIHLSYNVMKKYSDNRNMYYLVVGIFSLGIGMFARSMFEATGLLSHGWIIRDLPFWVSFIIIISLYNKKNITSLK